MPKVTLAAALAGIRDVLVAVTLLAACYAASALIWIQNGVVVKDDGYETQTTFWNLLPNWLSAGEAANAVSRGSGLIAIAIIFTFALRWAFKKGWRTLRVMAIRLTTLQKTER